MTSINFELEITTCMVHVNLELKISKYTTMYMKNLEKTSNDKTYQY